MEYPDPFAGGDNWLISESNENVFQESKGKVTDISGSNENVFQESSNQITHN